MSTNSGYRPTGARPNSRPTPAVPDVPVAGINAPDLPPVDQGVIARTPQAGEIALKQQQLGLVDANFAPALQQAKLTARTALAGHGGVGFAEDDPRTPQDESLKLTFDNVDGPGDKQRDAIKSVEYQHAAQGTLHSSFAERNIAGALARLDDERREVVQRYMGDIHKVFSDMNAERGQLVGELTSLYGAAGQWAAENPDPTYTPKIDNRPPLMTFDQYLKIHPNVKRTKDAARKWDARFNFGRLAAKGKV